MRARNLYLSILSMWFALTCFIDFVATPTVFRNVSSRIEAGDIGMILFTFINRVELVLAVVVLVLAYLFKETVKKKAVLFTTLFSLLILTVIYNVHMTPQVRHYTLEMREHDEDSVEYVRAQENHEFYHSLYKKTDSAKIITLLVLIVAGIRRKTEVVK